MLPPLKLIILAVLAIVFILQHTTMGFAMEKPGDTVYVGGEPGCGPQLYIKPGKIFLKLLSIFYLKNTNFRWQKEGRHDNGKQLSPQERSPPSQRSSPFSLPPSPPSSLRSPQLTSGLHSLPYVRPSPSTQATYLQSQQ